MITKDYLLRKIMTLILNYKHIIYAMLIIRARMFMTLHIFFATIIPEYDINSIY